MPVMVSPSTIQLELRLTPSGYGIGGHDGPRAAASQLFSLRPSLPGSASIDRRHALLRAAFTDHTGRERQHLRSLRDVQSGSSRARAKRPAGIVHAFFACGRIGVAAVDQQRG